MSNSEGLQFTSLHSLIDLLPSLFIRSIIILFVFFFTFPPENHLVLFLSVLP